MEGDDGSPARSHHLRTGRCSRSPSSCSASILLDPFFLERAKALAPGGARLSSLHHRYRQVELDADHRPARLAALALVLKRTHQGFRNAAGYGLIASTSASSFVSVGGAGLIANLAKYIFGTGAAETVRHHRSVRLSCCSPSRRITLPSPPAMPPTFSRWPPCSPCYGRGRGCCSTRSRSGSPRAAC